MSENTKKLNIKLSEQDKITYNYENKKSRDPFSLFNKEKKKIQSKKQKKKKFKKKKYVKKTEYYLNNKKKKNDFRRRKSGIEKIQNTLKNKLKNSKLNTPLKKKTKKKFLTERNIIKTNKQNILKRNVLSNLNKIQLDDLQEKDTLKINNNLINQTCSFNSDKSNLYISKFGTKKINFDENNLNWLGTFDQQYFKAVNIYSEPKKICKNNFELIKNNSNNSGLKKNKNFSEIQTKKKFYKQKLHESSDKLLKKKLLTKSFKNNNTSNYFSKIKKRGFNQKIKNINFSKTENHFLFKIISKEDLKNIFNDLDQKKMGLIGAKNLNFRKISAKNLKLFETLLLKFYENPNLVYDFEDFIKQCKLYIKV